jgi:predicted dehydrogenase
MSESVGYGIVGCGNIARFHIEGLLKAGARVVHLADVKEEAAAPFMSRTGARYSKDYHQLLADPAVTVVNVLTSTRWHKDICVDALGAGKDVICEKTMAGSAAEAAAIRDSAKKSGRIFFTAFMKRFFPAARMAKALVPRLGRIYATHVRAYQNWGNPVTAAIWGDDASAYQSVLDNYGGAVLKCAGSHMLDMTMFLLGRPSSVMASVDYVPGSRFDRKATALLGYDGGATACFETAIHSMGRIGLEKNGWEEWIEITGTEGRLKLSTVLWDHPENNGLLLEHYDEKSGSLTEHRFPPTNPFDLEMAELYAALVSRQPASPSEDDGYAVDYLIESIEEAARLGTRMKLTFPA